MPELPTPITKIGTTPYKVGSTDLETKKDLDQQEQLIFIEIGRGDASDFDAPLYVKGI
jgi:hypothetical protein